MPLFRRRRRLPDAARPPLTADERVVAWAEAPGERMLVATTRGLWLPAVPTATEPPAVAGPDRLGWHEIHKAVWSGRDLAVTPAQVIEENPGWSVVEDLPTVRFVLADPGDLPYQVRTRVTNSVGYTMHHPLPGTGGVRVVARRVPGVDGLRWSVRYDPGVDHDDPVVREVAAQLIAQATASLAT
jgi:hypothetical protein